MAYSWIRTARSVFLAMAIEVRSALNFPPVLKEISSVFFSSSMRLCGREKSIFICSTFRPPPQKLMDPSTDFIVVGSASSQSSGFVFVARASLLAFFQDGRRRPFKIWLRYASDIPDFLDILTWSPCFMAALLTNTKELSSFFFYFC